MPPTHSLRCTCRRCHQSPAKAIIARFGGGALSSNGGVLALREVEGRLGLPERLAGRIDDPRAPERMPGLWCVMKQG